MQTAGVASEKFSRQYLACLKRKAAAVENIVQVSRQKKTTLDFQRGFSV
jgi:hypothetical protein